MSSINISYLREEFPALSDSEAAAEYAKKWEIVMILQYKIHPDGEYTNLGICKSKSEDENYFTAPIVMMLRLYMMVGTQTLTRQ